MFSSASRIHATMVIAVLTAFALLVRGVIASRGGLWADEGFFLSVVRTPSWESMLSFLASHESHPPLFYIVMRAWIGIAGDTDAAARVLPVLISAAVIPVAWAAGASLFSRRAGLVAAVFTAVAPAMSEHGAQIRPYGLLALTVLVSCWSMILSLESERLRYRVVYVIATLAMLYTHHWGWLVAAGQHAAWAYVMVSRRRRRAGNLPRQWAATWIVIAIGYAPWVTALLSQATNAGHGGIPVESASDALMLLSYAAFTFFSTLVPGRFAPREVAAGLSFVFAAGMAVSMHVARGRTGAAKPEVHDRQSEAAAAVIGVTCAASVALAVLISPFSNMLLQRCLTVVVPLLALLFADWGVRAWQPGAGKQGATLAVFLCSILSANTAFELYALATTPRSNAREAARLVASRSKPTDLVLVAPAWYRPSFSRYLAEPLELAEFPHSDTGALVDFSNVWERVSDPSEMERTMSVVAKAHAEGRRVWVVTSAQYAREVSASEIAQAVKHRHPKPVTVSAVNQIRASIERQFGAADSTLLVQTRKPLYDDVRVYLHDPRHAAR